MKGETSGREPRQRNVTVLLSVVITSRGGNALDKSGKNKRKIKKERLDLDGYKSH